MLPGWRRALRAALQRGQSDPFAATQLGFSASSGRAWRLWAARHSQEEAGPLGAQPLPRVLELTASKAAHFTAFDQVGTATTLVSPVRASAATAAG